MDISSSNHSSSDWHIFIFLLSGHFSVSLAGSFSIHLLNVTVPYSSVLSHFFLFPYYEQSCSFLWLSASKSWIYIKTQFLSSRVIDTLPTWHLHLRCLLGILYSTSKIERIIYYHHQKPPLQKNPRSALGSLPNFISLTLQLPVAQPRNLDSLWIFLPDSNQ